RPAPGNTPPIMNASFPLGAVVVEGGVRFRVWAPDHRTVDVVLEREGSERGGVRARENVTERASAGCFSGSVRDARAGDRYRYRLDGGEALPDPVSRFQPDGPHGPSCVVDAKAFEWSDAAWKGCSIEGQLIYEMH